MTAPNFTLIADLDVPEYVRDAPEYSTFEKRLYAWVDRVIGAVTKVEGVRYSFCGGSEYSHKFMFTSNSLFSMLEAYKRVGRYLAADRYIYDWEDDTVIEEWN